MKLDKSSEQWKSVPTWVSLTMSGLKTRKSALDFEYFCLCLGVLGIMGALEVFIHPHFVFLMPFLASAYWYAVTVRWIDNANLWQTNT